MAWLNSLIDKNLGMLVGAIVALIVMWRDIALLKINFASHRDAYQLEINRLSRTQDQQETVQTTFATRMAAQDVTLARIDENIKTLLSKREQLIG